MENKKSKKVWKIILMIVIIIIVLFLMHTIRNLIIINKLSSKTSKYTSSTNYHVKTVAHYEEGTTTVDFYKKDNRTVHIIEANRNEKVSKLMAYDNGSRIDIFIDNGETKIANLDCNALLGKNEVYNLFEIERLREIIAYSLVSRIKSVNCNDKKCYRITSDMSLQYVHNMTEEKEEVVATFEMEKSEMYIDKDTGLIVKRITSAETVEKEYEFNNVDDSVFVEPDISKYELKK